jgi:hypothetical protein
MYYSRVFAFSTVLLVGVGTGTHSYAQTLPNIRWNACGSPPPTSCVVGATTVTPPNMVFGSTDETGSFGSINVNDLVTSIYSPLNQQLTAIAAQMDRNNRRMTEGIALSAAVVIMPPNPGDRFSLTFGGSGFNGQGAGTISASMRLHERALIFVGYGRSSTQTLVKGGVSFSFK